MNEGKERKRRCNAKESMLIVWQAWRVSVEAGEGSEGGRQREGREGGKEGGGGRVEKVEGGVGEKERKGKQRSVAEEKRRSGVLLIQGNKHLFFLSACLCLSACLFVVCSFFRDTIPFFLSLDLHSSHPRSSVLLRPVHSILPSPFSICLSHV